MTGITAYTGTGNIGAGMVGIRIKKTLRSMTVTAFRPGIRVGATLGNGSCLACRDRTVMTTAAGPGYTRMIKAAVRQELQEMPGIVAVIAFGFRGHMKF